MFTQPSVNQIASTYQGNPAPLARKVDQDKKQNGGIPQDLRQLLALNDITQGRNAMGIQQALQIPTNMPTVAQDLQERARQALQARQMQAMQEMMRKDGKPNMVPMGTPRPPMQAQGLDSLESNVGEGYAEGGIVGFDDGGDVALEAYQQGRYKDASDLLAKAGMNAQDVVSKYGLSQADAATVAKNLGYTGDMSGIQYAAPPVDQTTNIQNLPVIRNNNASDTSFLNPIDTEISNYYDKNKNLFESKDYNKIASDMYVNEFTPEAFAQTMGWDQKAVADLYNKTYGALDRATQENLVNQKYKKKLGLTDEQLGQRNFGAPMDTRENRLASSPFSNAYETYQEELAATGRRDAPAGTQFRAKAVYAPDSIGNRGSIKLIDSLTGQELTNLGGANSIGNTANAFELLDKFGVDPASYKQAASQMYESMGKPSYMQDDYKYLTGYKPRDVAGATDTYLTKPLASATSADLKPKYEKDANDRQTADSKTNVFYEVPMTNLLRSKGLSITEASNILGQLRPIAGLVNFAEISRSKDPVKALIGTLNYFQSKGLINKRFASGGIASLDSNTLVGNAQRFKEGGIIGFDGTGSSQFVQDIAALPQAFDDMKKRAREEDEIRAAQDRRMAQRKQEALEARQKTSFFNYLFGSPEREKEGQAKLTEMSSAPLSAPAKPEAVKATPLADIRSQLNLADASSRAQPGTPPPPREKPAAQTQTQTQTRVNTDSAPMPAGLQGLASSLATPGGDYTRKILNQDENVIAAAKQALYDKEVGARDLSIYDRTAAELEARKQKLNAPKAGYDAMMEYLEQIALGGGRTSAESGAIGASRQRALQKSRLSEQDTLMDKILELGAKKSDAMFAEKKGRFDLTQAEKDRVIKEKLEAAKQLNLSEDETRKLIEQSLQKELDRKAQAAENEKNRKNQLQAAAAGNRDNLMSRALALMAADPTKKMTLDQAMQRAGEIANAGAMESAEVRNRKAYDDAIKDLNSELRYMPVRLDKKNDPKLALLRAEYENKIKELQGRYKVTDQGLNALPTSTGLPAGVTVTQVK